jgi:biotin synthase
MSHPHCRKFIQLKYIAVRYIFILAGRNELKYTKDSALNLLKSEGQNLEVMYLEADAIRRQKMGDEIYIRAIVEFSNICTHNCLYCGIRASNNNVRRYSMSADEIVEAAFSMEKSNLSTIVLQSGDSPGVRDE